MNENVNQGGSDQWRIRDSFALGYKTKYDFPIHEAREEHKKDFYLFYQETM